jgi:hypothetical protein
MADLEKENKMLKF